MNPPGGGDGGSSRREGSRKRRSSGDSDFNRVIQRASGLPPNGGLMDIDRRIRAILAVGKPIHERRFSTSSATGGREVNPPAPHGFPPPSAEEQKRVAAALRDMDTPLHEETASVAAALRDRDTPLYVEIPVVKAEPSKPVLRDFLGKMEGRDPAALPPRPPAPVNEGPSTSRRGRKRKPVLRDFLGQMERRDKGKSPALEKTSYTTGAYDGSRPVLETAALEVFAGPKGKYAAPATSRAMSEWFLDTYKMGYDTQGKLGPYPYMMMRYTLVGFFPYPNPSPNPYPNPNPNPSMMVYYMSAGFLAYPNMPSAFFSGQAHSTSHPYEYNCGH